MPMKITELPCGAKIKFGAYCVENEGAHKIKWIKAENNVAIFITEFIEDFRAFDAREPNNPRDYRARYGNNRYSVSNIDRFLNSREDEWYEASHPYDRAPIDGMVRNYTDYKNHPGFLAYFSDWEIDAIEDTAIKVEIPKCDRDSFSAETINRKVFLPSMMNIFGRAACDVEEGKYWDYFRECRTTAQPTEWAVNNSRLDEDQDSEENWYYLLRSPDVGGSYSVRYVNRDGDYGSYNAYNGLLGVRPALVINPEIFVTDEVDDEGYYEVIQNESENSNFSENEFLKLLSA